MTHIVLRPSITEKRNKDLQNRSKNFILISMLIYENLYVPLMLWDNNWHITILKKIHCALIYL